MSHSFAYNWYQSQDLLDTQLPHQHQHQHRTIASYPVYTYPTDETRSQASVTTDSAETAWDSARALHFDSEPPSVPLASESAGDNHDYPPISSPTRPLSAHVPSTAPTSTASSPPTSVKIEPDDPDSRFIMDLAAYPPQSTTSSRSSPESYGFNEVLQSPVPPAEVPLRATQASKEMRRMMGVFRLNPFAMHNLSRNGDGDDSALGSPTGSVTWCGEAGPLEEEPVMIEFQLNIVNLNEDGLHAECSDIKNGLPVISAEEESQLRPFSPSFELPEGIISEGQENHSSDPDQRFEGWNDQAMNTEKDFDDNDRRGGSWEDVDRGVRTESDGSTSTSSTVSVLTPLNETTCSPFHNIQDGLSVGACEQDEHAHTTSLSVEIPSPPLWNAVGVAEQYENSASSISAALGTPRLNFVYPDSPNRGQRVHSNNTHPYLRKNVQNYPMSPTDPAHPYPRTYSHSIPHQHQIQAQPNVFALNLPQQTSYQLRRLSLVQDPTTPQDDHASPTTPNNLQYPVNQQQQQQNPQSHHQTLHHQHHQQQQQVYSGHHTQMSSVGTIPVSTSVCVRRSTLPAGFAVAGGPNSSVIVNAHPNSGASYAVMRSSGRGPTYANRFEELEGEQEGYVSSPHSPTIHAHQSHTLREGLYPAQQHHHHHPNHQQQQHLSHHHHNHHQQEVSSPSSPLSHGQGHSGAAATVTGISGTVAGHPPTTSTMAMRAGHVVATSPATGNQNLRRWSLPEATVHHHHHIGHSGAFLGH